MDRAGPFLSAAALLVRLVRGETPSPQPDRPKAGLDRLQPPPLRPAARRKSPCGKEWDRDPFGGCP